VNSGYTLFFRASHKLLKNPECKNYIQYSEKFQGKFCFQSKRKSLKNPYFNAVNILKANSVFQGKQKLLKHPECETYIKYSEKFHDKLCFQGKRKFLKNPER